jgi:hypothetical protein
VDIWFDDKPDDLSQPPSRWLFEHFEEYADWMTTTQTYDQYRREHAAQPVNPVMPKAWWGVVEV